MGAWGTGIFSNDIACDVRSAYEEILSYWNDADEAERRVIADFELNQDHPEEDNDAWLALAATEWQCGRKVSERVRMIACALIANPIDMENWNGNNEKKQRLKVLNELRCKLDCPLPTPKRFKKRSVVRCPWKIGDIIAIKMMDTETCPTLSGKYALLHLVKISTYKVSRYAPDHLRSEEPCFLVKYWYGNHDELTGLNAGCLDYAILTQDATEWGKPIIRQHAILKFSLFQKEMPMYKELSVICNIDPPDFDYIKQRYGWGKSTSLATCGGDLIYWMSSSCREKLI